MDLGTLAATQNSQAAAQGAQSAAAAAAGLGANGSGSASSTGTNGTINTVAQLSSNFNTFLNLLLTQLQNQDPTTPMDTNQFTSELVQYSSVEQQIQTNTSLGSLISLTQGGELLQGAAIDGKTVTLNGANTVLSNGTATLGFNAPAAEPVTLQIADSAGNAVFTATVNAAAGANTTTWNGTNNQGAQVPDGVYKVTALATSAGGATTAVPVTETAQVTGISTGANNTTTVNIGTQSVPFSAIQSIQ